MEKTQWYNGTQRPAYIGVYEREKCGWQHLYSKWDGSKWLIDSHTVGDADDQQFTAFYQDIPWRGLVK